MWEINIEEKMLKDVCAKLNSRFSRLSLIIRTTTIRDGTPGISLSVLGEVIGEWTDSRAAQLGLTEDYKVIVYGQKGNARYLINLPGIVLSGEQASANEVKISAQL